MLMSHRVSGPVYRFERSAEAISNGDLTVRVRIREKDEMKETAATMDDTIETFKARITGLKQKTRRIREDAEILLEALNHGTLTEGELTRLKEKITHLNDELQSDLSRFKL